MSQHLLENMTPPQPISPVNGHIFGPPTPPPWIRDKGGGLRTAVAPALLLVVQRHCGRMKAGGEATGLTQRRHVHDAQRPLGCNNRAA